MYFLFANPQKPETIRVARRLAGLLLDQDERVLLDSWLYDELRLGAPASLAELTGETDVIISLGGDGTLLRTLPTAARHRIPVLGVNMGRVGFLLETDEAGLPAALDRIRRKDYVLEQRIMLSCRINGGEEQLVMNDAVLCRGANPSSIVVDVFAEDELIYSTHGDGVIVSTATGSTSYCLSAGGPVLHPGLSNIVVLPICTHKAQQLPVVLDGALGIRLRAEEVPDRSHQVVFDGLTCSEMPGPVDVTIRQAKETALFIRLAPQQFFTRLRQKQTDWSMR